MKESRLCLSLTMSFCFTIKVIRLIYFFLQTILKHFTQLRLSVWSTKQTHHSLNVAQLQQCQVPSITNIIPVFGTEEALVEPMLLALDTTVPFLAPSVKKPAE